MRRLFTGIIGTVVGASIGWTVPNFIPHAHTTDTFFKSVGLASTSLGGAKGLALALLVGRKRKRSRRR